MADRKKLQMFKTPAGIAVYPWLNRADTQFNADGEYRVKLRVAGSEAEELIKLIDTEFNKSLAKAKADFKNDSKKLKKVKPCANKPYQPAEDDEGEETGEMEFNFKMKAIIRPKDKDPIEQSPRLFDTKGKPLGDVSIGGGSKIKVAFNIVPFYTVQLGAGVTLRLKAVQVIDLVEYQGASASSYGFEEEEGYEFEEDDPSVTDEQADAAQEGDF